MLRRLVCYQNSCFTQSSYCVELQWKLLADLPQAARNLLFTTFVVLLYLSVSGFPPWNSEVGMLPSESILQSARSCDPGNLVRDFSISICRWVVLNFFYFLKKPFKLALC